MLRYTILVTVLFAALARADSLTQVEPSLHQVHCTFKFETGAPATEGTLEIYNNSQRDGLDNAYFRLRFLYKQQPLEKDIFERATPRLTRYLLRARVWGIDRMEFLVSTEGCLKNAVGTRRGSNQSRSMWEWEVALQRMLTGGCARDLAVPEFQSIPAR